ncbi:MAG: response regulator [Pseudomonadota bacterium]
MGVIAVIEDEADILDVISYNLRREGFDVISSMRGDTGLELIKQNQVDLIMLDLMLPGMNGLDVCKALRAHERFAFTPIIMLTAKSEEADTVLGLDVGANDYVAKPFSPKELMARIKAQLRHASMTHKMNQPTDSQISIDGLIIDKEKHKVTLDGELLQFTASEFRLLFALADKAGRVLTREQLLGDVLTDHAVVIDRNVDVHVRSIRKKLGSRSSLIETVRGVGYRFKEL